MNPLSRAPHILVIPSWYPTAEIPQSGIFFREQVIALRNAGVRIGVVAPQVMGLGKWLKAGRPDTSVTCTEEDGGPVYRQTILSLRPKSKGRDRAAWIESGKAMVHRYIADVGSPDLVHAHSVFYGGILAQAAGLPYLITEHASYLGKLRRDPARLAWAKSAYRDARARIAVSQGFGKEIDAITDGAFSPFVTIPNLLATAFDPPPPKTEPAVFTVLTACRLVPHKGVACLLQAMARIAGEWRLRVAGDGPERANLQSLARELGIADQVTFLGDLDHKTIAAEMASSSLFALASEREPFGVVLIEAASCGTPVVATRTSGATDIVTDQIGTLADIDDASALASAIEGMRNRQHDVEGARAYCAERYSPASVARQISQLYLSLCGSSLD